MMEERGLILIVWITIILISSMAITGLINSFLRELKKSIRIKVLIGIFFGTIAILLVVLWLIFYTR